MKNDKGKTNNTNNMIMVADSYRRRLERSDVQRYQVRQRQRLWHGVLLVLHHSRRVWKLYPIFSVGRYKRPIKLNVL